MRPHFEPILWDLPVLNSHFPSKNKLTCQYRSHGFVVGHITPAAYEGGPLTIVEDGDEITIDATTRELNLNISDGEIKQRLAKWRQPAPRYTRGVLAKYAKTVSSASEGAVTGKNL